MKELWFKYVMDNKSQWCTGFTMKRLIKVKDAVLTDSHIMSDLLNRHSGSELTPAQMHAAAPETFNHCIGNFRCAIFDKMVETGIYKIK